MAGKSSNAENGKHSLRGGVLGVFESSIMGLAGSAPAYSIAATTFTLAAVVGLGAPAELIYCGIAMFGIVYAFKYLSAHDPHAGASYSWVRNGIHPALGYLAGWSLVTASLIFSVSATLPASQSIISLFSNADPTKNKTLEIVVGAIIFMVMVAIVAFGVTITSTAQVIMSTIETVLLVLFLLLALFHAHHVQSFHWSWLYSFHGIGGISKFTVGALSAAFFYWGWDVTSNLNEETKGARRTSGIGAVNGVVSVMILYVVATVAIQMMVSQKDIQSDGANILTVIGNDIWSGWPGKLIVISVVLSTIATLETQLIQITRTLFTMGRDNSLPSMLGTTHQKFKTPLWATAISAIITLVLFLVSTLMGSINSILTDANNAIGIQICFYYGLAAVSVITIYRKELFKSFKNFFFIGLWPAIGALFMIFIFIEIIPVIPHFVAIDKSVALDTRAWVLGLGSIVVGIIPMLIYWARGSVYFKTPTPEERTAIISEFEAHF
jgi:amino acid transporter